MGSVRVRHPDHVEEGISLDAHAKGCSWASGIALVQIWPTQTLLVNA